MVAISADLFNRDVVSLFNRLGDIQNCSAHLRRQERLAIFDRKDEVVVSIVCSVIASGDAHAHSVSENQTFSDFRLWRPRPKGRGMLGFK